MKNSMGIDEKGPVGICYRPHAALIELNTHVPNCDRGRESRRPEVVLLEPSSRLNDGSPNAAGVSSRPSPARTIIVKRYLAAK